MSVYALIQSTLDCGLPRSNPARITTDLPALQKDLRGKLVEIMKKCKEPVANDAADNILSAVDAGEPRCLLYSNLDSFDLRFTGSVFTGFTHIRRSMSGPKHETWEIHPVPAWKVDPQTSQPESLLVIQLDQSSLQGVYSNAQTPPKVVYIDQDRELYPNPDTDRKVACLSALVEAELVRDIYDGREGSIEDMDAVLTSTTRTPV